MGKLVNLLLLLVLLVNCSTALPAPDIESFVATKNNLPFGGDKIVLSWTVQRANELRLDPNIGIVRGSSVEVSVTDTTTFVLTAKGTGGETKKEIVIDVADGSFKINGKLENWSRGERQLQVPITLLPKLFRSFGESTTMNVQAKMQTNGEFEILLPSAKQMEEKLLETVLASKECPEVKFPQEKAKMGRLYGFSALNKMGTESIAYGFLKKAGYNDETNVSWLYSDRDLSIQGGCIRNDGLRLEFANVQLKHGWNIIVQENFNFGFVRISNANTMPEGVAWNYFMRDLSSVTINRENLPIGQSAEIGRTYQLTAKYTDAEGEWVKDAAIEWLNTNQPDEKILDIDANGLVTPKKFGYGYVGAKFGNKIDQFNVNTYGLEVGGGTYNELGKASLSTTFISAYKDEQGNLNTKPLALVLSGPEGWNNNQPVDLNISAVGDKWKILDIPAVTGKYIVKPKGVDQNFKGVEYFIDANNKINYPYPVRLNWLSPTILAATWDQPFNDLKSRAGRSVTLIDASTNRAVFDQKGFFESKTQFQFENLNSTKQYELELLHFAISPMVWYYYGSAEQFNVSYGIYKSMSPN